MDESWEVVLWDCHGGPLSPYFAIAHGRTPSAIANQHPRSTLDKPLSVLRNEHESLYEGQVWHSLGFNWLLVRRTSDGVFANPGLAEWVNLSILSLQAELQEFLGLCR